MLLIPATPGLQPPAKCSQQQLDPQALALSCCITQQELSLGSCLHIFRDGGTQLIAWQLSPLGVALYKLYCLDRSAQGSCPVMLQFDMQHTSWQAR